MRAVTRGAVAAAGLAVVSALAGVRSRSPESSTATTSAPARLVAPCPPRSLPEGPICVPMPKPSESARVAATDPVVPRYPERPMDLQRYVLPLDLDDGAQAGHAAVIRGATVSVSCEPGAEVRAAALDGQEGPTRVLYAGVLEGSLAVVTVHDLAPAGSRDADRHADDAGAPARRTALLIHRGLERVADGAVPGAALEPGKPLGFVAKAERAEGGLLELSARLMRAGVAPTDLAPSRATSPGASVAVDPRNVLPLRPSPAP